MSGRSKSPFTSESNRHSDANVANTSWQEWKDSDLNNEKWGIPKDGPDGLFLDTERVVMPRSLEPDQWIRAKDLKHLTGPLTIYTTTMGYSDLITNNKHLLHSEFVRWFVSALMNLQYCGREGLEISGESSNFAWASRYSPWYGWMHVYSLNKAGKGVQHRPVINPNGKYIIRLYCMGCWRRILVDDIIPVDKGGKPLLPCTSNNFELWPMLLAKALLKVASLTWIRHREIVEFHPITCFTGWICLTLNVTHLSMQDKWDLLTKYSERFEWTMQTVHNYVPESSKSATTDKTRKPGETLRLLADAEKPITLFLLLGDTRELGNDAVPGLSPCWDHVIHVVQSRDVPLDPKDVKLPLAKWKMHRWLKWSISQNIIDPADYFVPIRYLKVISPLMECNESVVYAYDKNDAGGNLIPLNEIEQSDKPALKMKSQNIPNLSIMEKEAAIISRWIDFNKMAPHVTEVHMFFKLEYFQYSIQVMGNVSQIASENRKIVVTKEIKKEKGGIEKTVITSDTYNWPNRVLKYRNKPMYLFCDSLEKKFFLVSLCVAPKNTDQTDYLILEKYNWFFSSNQSDQSIIISTTGNKSTVVELEAGRQLLRIYFHSESSLVIISSNTSFHLGDRMTVQQLMTAESDRIEQMSKIISNSLCEAYRSFGTKDYPVMLKDYYRSYIPSLLWIPSRENKNFRMQIHHFFMEEQVRLIGNIFPTKEFGNILNTLRIFFLNPNIRLGYFNLMTTQKILQNFKIEKTSKTWLRDKGVLDYDQAATIIQSFFKMILVKKYKQLHSSDHALYMQVRKELLVLSDLFDSSLTCQLLRNVINRHSSLCDLYPCFKDFVHVLNIQEFRSVLENIKNEQWFPIARFVVNSKPAETVFAGFELLVDLPSFALRVFNNQNGREMMRVVNHVAPARYEYLPDGYTVFAYGWNEEQRFKEFGWAIRVVTMKEEPMLYQLGEQSSLFLEAKLPQLKIEKFVGTYIPNVKNYISRWTLRAISGSIISIRLTTSYQLAEIRIKVTDEAGKILADVYGSYTVLLPLVILKHSIRNEKYDGAKNRGLHVNKEFRNAVEEQNLYYVETFVLNNSWPLTDDEWMVVNRIKMKNGKYFKTEVQSANKESRSDQLMMKKNLKQFTNNDRALESPYWIFQVVTDTRDAIEIYPDERREQEVALLKDLWCSKDPDRFERGKNLRETFLNVHVSKAESEMFLNQNQLKSTKDEDIVFCLLHARQRRTLKSPDSYHHLFASNLTKYMGRDEILKHPWINTENDNEKLRKQDTINIIDSQKNYSSYLQNLAEQLKEQLRKYIKFFKMNEESFWKRRALVNAAYESRKIYIDSLMSERMKSKEKKGKKD